MYLFFLFFSGVRRFISRYTRYVFSEELCGGVNGVAPFGVSVVREFAQ